MTYVSQQINYPTGSVKYPEPLNPSLLVAAQEIYNSYRKTHPANLRRPVGIVMHQESCRGQLVFREKPILLPYECFVPFEQIEAKESN